MHVFSVTPRVSGRIKLRIDSVHLSSIGHLSSEKLDLQAHDLEG